MRERRIIPVTPLWRRYQELRTAPQEHRLAEARRLIDHPEELAEEFAASVAAFSAYANVEDHFYPPQRARHEPNSTISRTIDVVLRLEAQGHLVPVNSTNRLTTHNAGTSVVTVPAHKLAADYVDRELLVQRTTSPAEWSDGRRNIGGLRLDVLLADAVDRTPIVGELKLPGDMDPFFALIQALACAAHLATRDQYTRMRTHLSRGAFRELADPPRLDIWLLFLDAQDAELDCPPEGRYMAELRAAAEVLAPRLLAQDGIGASIRRIAGLGLIPTGTQSILSEVRWAWQRQGR